MEKKFSRLGFVRSQVVPALLLFAIPLLGHAFARHAQRTLDARFFEGMSAAVNESHDISHEAGDSIRAYFRAHPPSELCASAEGRDHLPPAYEQAACGEHNQMRWIERASHGSLVLGVLSLLFVVACVGIAFASRELQYLGFVAGWNFLRVASALQVLAQGFIAVMLSFWVTAFYFERYSIKLIAIVGVAAIAAALVLIKAIFRKPADKLTVEGEPLSREASPQLWERVQALCARLGTEPPHTIVAGIDDNFFVTEHPMHAGARVFEGRSLFISLSLLKRLSKSEADAVLAHEMAHFSGGDTLYSKKLAPMLSRYIAYMEALHAGALSRPVFYFMLFYWSLFQIPFSRQRRERELRADKLAAEATSPESIGNALLKVAAYSCYRARVERGMFERNRAHSDLDIAHSVAAGFVEYARGQSLADDLQAENAVPHPFDSHPSLVERFRNVGLEFAKPMLVERVVNTEVQTWFSEIADAERIETALWDAYETRFKAAHEEALAYRYLPANDAERAHVERFFPPVAIAGQEHALNVSCEQLHYGEWAAPVRWQDINKIVVKDKTLRGKVVSVSFSGPKSAESVEITLKKLSLSQDEVLAVIGRYYTRALAAKQHQR